MFGGGVSFEAFELDEIPVFNLETNEWTSLPSIGDASITDNNGFPLKRKCHGCVQDPHDKALVFINGGYNDNSSVYNDTWRIDLRTLEWKRITSLNLPNGTYFHSAACTPDGRMVVFGGITINKRHTGHPHERTADVFSTWIRIPRLADACWDALDFYIRKKIITLPDDIRSWQLPFYDESRLRSAIKLNYPDV